MLARTVRSGLTEAFHDGTACVADAEGAVLQAWGDTTRPIFYRSAIKPFQATIALELGAELEPEEIAVASASHGGHPIHLAYVTQILAKANLDDEALRCPRDWPMSRAARDRVVRAGDQPRRLFHNCSGKHAASLLAARAAGLPLDSYESPEHPIQQRVVDLIREVSGAEPTPVGVDGCGFPTLRGTTESLAIAFARFSTDDRFARVRDAISRFPSLSGDALRPDGAFGAWWSAALKIGAMGLVGAGNRGVGVAVKSWEGSLDVAMVGLMEVANRRNMLSEAGTSDLGHVARPPVLGGGVAVGAMVPDLR
ncbi:MAG: asparaginase [Acidimicrobiia bacterium]|nr:asparaginase [Acidimicrobiia bacterium]NNF65539.1 asparaginase [Acidimicrobiia bacterium]